MYEVNFTSSNLNLIDFANFTTDFVVLDLNRSELEIRMNISKMRVGRFNPHSVSIISQVDGELFIDGTILDIFPIYGDGPFWVEVSFTSVEPKFQSLFRFMVLPRVSSLTSISMAKDLCK